MNPLDMNAFESSEELSNLVELRRWFHQHAELSFHEVETAQRIMDELDRLRIPYTYGGEGGGVIARQIVDDDAPTVALRAEMDALPGKETTGAPYTSMHEGTMHACGHGAHMAMVLGAAALLKKSPPAGNVIYVFQPAEERGGGSRKVISAGALVNVQAIFAGHVTHDYAVGRIMVADGIVTSQSDRFSINVCGEGGHGARPHEATDAVIIAGFLITAIQTLVSREVNPLHPSVVTIGQVHAGTAPNVIAEEATLEGSIRTTRPEVRQHIHDGIRRMAEAVGLLHNARVNVDIAEGYPPVVNSKPEAVIARAAAHKILGESGIAEMEHPSMGSEDFSYYLNEVPGCFVRFGARDPDWEPVPLHSSGFDIDERVLPVGARFFEQVARDFLAEKNARNDQHAPG
jgi:hippurate hydrolase